MSHDRKSNPATSFRDTVETIAFLGGLVALIFVLLAFFGWIGRLVDSTEQVRVPRSDYSVIKDRVDLLVSEIPQSVESDLDVEDWDTGRPPVLGPPAGSGVLIVNTGYGAPWIAYENCLLKGKYMPVTSNIVYVIYIHARTGSRASWRYKGSRLHWTEAQAVYEYTVYDLSKKCVVYRGESSTNYSKPTDVLNRIEDQRKTRPTVIRTMYQLGLVNRDMLWKYKAQ